MSVVCPFLGFFIELRKAGLALDIDNLRLLIRALEGGFGIEDQASFVRLCKILWVKSEEEERLFDYQFETLLKPLSAQKASMQKVEGPLQPVQPNSTEKEEKPNVPSEDTTATVEPIENQIVRMVSALEEVEAFSSVQVAISSRDYLPLSRRNMKQSWRYLRQMVREGPPMEINVGATLDRVARQGFLLAPVIVPRRINRAELFLFVDYGGSMAPFHDLSRRLINTATRGGNLRRTVTYYFHNCPGEYVFKNPNQLEPIQLAQVIDEMDAKRSYVVCITDAGAARGQFSPLRVAKSQHFIEQISQKHNRIAFLNPMPRLRWSGTASEAIAQSIPMFELTRHGLDSVIATICGRQSADAVKIRHVL